MSASSIETKDVIKSNCSSSSSKRNDSIYSISGLNLKGRMLQRKAQNRQAAFMSGSVSSGLNSDIRQRVLSARQNRHKSLQNQLNLALQHNAELTNENRLLKTLHKRQDNALAKYEGTSGELPQLINSHTEELRVWQTKYRTLNLQNRELNKKIQQKDRLLNEVTDRLKHLTILTAEKHLEERETLTSKLQSMEKILSEKDEEIKMLTRKNAIEAKNYKTHLANERKKYKELCQKHNSARDKQNLLSNDSDYSSAKDIKELKHTNFSSLSASSAISEETPPADLHVDIEDDDDDDDELVIKRIIDKDIDNNNDESQQLIQQLADLNIFVNDDSQNIQAIHEKIQKDIEKNEALLDLHCDAISRDINAFNLPPKDMHLFDAIDENEMNRNPDELPPMNDLLLFKSNRSDETKDSFLINTNKPKVPRTTSCLPRFNISVGGKPLKRTPIDPQKKSKLLAQLKSIDTSNGGL